MHVNGRALLHLYRNSVTIPSTPAITVFVPNAGCYLYHPSGLTTNDINCGALRVTHCHVDRYALGAAPSRNIASR